MRRWIYPVPLSCESTGADMAYDLLDDCFGALHVQNSRSCVHESFRDNAYSWSRQTSSHSLKLSFRHSSTYYPIRIDRPTSRGSSTCDKPSSHLQLLCALALASSNSLSRTISKDRLHTQNRKTDRLRIHPLFRRKGAAASTHYSNAQRSTSVRRRSHSPCHEDQLR